EDMVDEPFESRSIGDGQIALEDHAVKAREHGDDQVGKLGDEARQRLHGVLLRVGATSNPILAGERCYCSSFLVAASPRSALSKCYSVIFLFPSPAPQSPDRHPAYPGPGREVFPMGAER